MIYVRTIPGDRIPLSWDLHENSFANQHITTTNNKLNGSNISAVADPILTKP